MKTYDKYKRSHTILQEDLGKSLFAFLQSDDYEEVVKKLRFLVKCSEKYRHKTEEKMS